MTATRQYLCCNFGQLFHSFNPRTQLQQLLFTVVFLLHLCLLALMLQFQCVCLCRSQCCLQG